MYIKGLKVQAKKMDINSTQSLKTISDIRGYNYNKNKACKISNVIYFFRKKEKKKKRKVLITNYYYYYLLLLLLLFFLLEKN